MKLMERVLGHIVDVIDYKDNTEIFIHSIETGCIYYSIVIDDKQGRMMRTAYDGKTLNIKMNDDFVELNYKGLD